MRTDLEPPQPRDFPFAAGDNRTTLRGNSRERALDSARICERALEIRGYPARTGWIDIRIEGSGHLVAFLSHETDVDHRASHGGRRSQSVRLARYHYDFSGRRRLASPQRERNRSSPAGRRIGVVTMPFAHERAEIEIAGRHLRSRRPRRAAGRCRSNAREGENNDE